MTKIRLELEKLQIFRDKERWNIYFVVVAEHPTDSDKFIVTALPSPHIKFKPAANNIHHFEPEGNGTDGFFILEREMPEDRSIKVRIYLRHSRNGVRDLGKILEDLQSGIGGQAFGIIENVVGTTVPWLAIAKKAVNLVGSILEKIPDRDFGMISMDEDFGPEFENQTELDRSNVFPSGHAKLVWSWVVKK